MPHRLLPSAGPRIAIIGGGVSGLACARAIVDGIPGAAVTVLEAASEPGGAVRSGRSDGFLWESGPHGFLDSDPATMRLAHRLGLKDRMLPADEVRRGRFIFLGGRLHRFPDGPLRFLLSDLVSLRGRARVLAEPLLRSAPPLDDESVGALARRRLGDEVAERLVDPLVCGIYGGDMDRLSVKASAPQLAAMVRGGGSLLGALRRSRARRPAGSGAGGGAGSRRLVSCEEGIGQLVRTLAASLEGAVCCDSPVAAVHPDGASFRVAIGGARPRELVADAVIAAVAAPVARALFGRLDGDLDEALGSIRYLPAAVVALGFREADLRHALDGFGYLVPRVEGGSVLGVLFSSSMFPRRRSPEGTVLVQAILGGVRRPDICDEPDARLEAEVCAQLDRAVGLRGAPIFRRTFRHAPGIPQYEVGHHLRVARIAAAEARLPGLFLTGNALRGVGINACTADAERVAARVLARFGEGVGAAASSS